MHDDHDHSQATHSMHCPVEGCGNIMEVHAHDDEQAVTLLVAAGDSHFAEVGHPIDQAMTPEKKAEMTRQHMKKAGK